MTEPIDVSVPPERHRLCRVRRGRRLVGAPAPLRAVRAHRVLRLVPVAAREQARATPPGTRSCSPSSRVRAGSGITAPRTTTTGRSSRNPTAIRSSRACPARANASRPTGDPRSTDRCGSWRWLRSRDPHGVALRRAVRAAVVVPVNFAIASQVIGTGVEVNSGGFSFGVGTVVTTPDWLAVVASAVFGCSSPGRSVRRPPRPDRLRCRVHPAGARSGVDR